jgi:hypothetical protein
MGQLVDLHLERGLRLNAEPEYKGLYSWAINEIDTQGKQIGHDQIPWDWTLYFTATSAVLGDSIGVKKQYQADETVPPRVKVEQRQVIQVQLRPGDPRDEDDFRRDTTYRMFGTNRAIKSFQLNIHPIADPAEQESCRVWGCPSYTSETDFSTKTTDDCIFFYLYVKPETFARYAAKVSLGTANEIIFSVEEVAGFYSEWSPSISTREVKVLTRDHRVDLPPDLPFQPPRLGDVGDATLYINRHLEFGRRAPDPQPVAKTVDRHLEFSKRAPDPQPVEKAVEVEREPVASEPPASAELDPRILKTLRSLKRAAWFVVVLLVLIFITTLFR